VYSLVRAELQPARGLAEELIQLAASAPTPDFHLKRAHNVLGITSFWLGEFAAARMHFEQGLRLDGPQQPSALDFFYGQDAGVVSLAYLACVLWFLGYPDQSLCKSQEALAVAWTLAHPHSLALVLQQAPPDTSRAERCFQQALAIARRQQAKAWELRAAISLSRLWGRSGEYAKAHQLLAGCYDWYTEGFDTTDLRAAQGLLTDWA
jgi:predicted ATPase